MIRYEPLPGQLYVTFVRTDEEPVDAAMRLLREVGVEDRDAALSWCVEVRPLMPGRAT